MADSELVVKDNVISLPSLPLPQIKGLGHTYFTKMKEFRNEIALTDGISGEKHTYETVLKKSVRAAITMRSRGLKPKDIISICSENHPNVLIPHFAASFLGAMTANLDPLLPLLNCVHLLKQVRPKMIFVNPEAVPLMENALKEADLDSLIVVFGNSTKHVQFSDFLAPSSEEDDFAPYEVQDLKETAALVFSSGTTGLPKAICLTHFGMVGSVLQYRDVSTGIRVLVYSTLYWVIGNIFTPLLVFYGSNRVTCGRFDTDTVWNILDKEKINMVVFVPQQVIEMCANGRPEGIDTSSLKSILIGGAPCSKETILLARKCFPNTTVISSLGTTEVNGNVMSFNIDKDRHFIEQKPESVGRPRRGYSCKVVDPKTEEVLGPNQPGELRVKSEFAMNGYYGMDSSNAWDSDGFVKTGDIVYYDEDYCFFVVGRIKELMKYRNWHIAPLQIELVLHTHPAVKECLVTSRTHEVDGDHLLGLVVLNSNHVGKVREKELEQYVNGKVGSQFELRAGVKFVENIPHTMLGKPDRITAKNLVNAGKI